MINIIKYVQSVISISPKQTRAISFSRKYEWYTGKIGGCRMESSKHVTQHKWFPENILLNDP